MAFPHCQDITTLCIVVRYSCTEYRGIFYRVPDDSSIRWVITVPAIWSEESKQFMREAAYKVGLI